VSMAVVPVSLANLHAPVLPEPEPMPVRDLWRVAPLAPVGAVVTGFIGSAILGGGVVYAADVGLNRLVTGLFIGAALVGGGALQVPLGNWSDRVDRRFVILVSSVAAVGVSLAIAAVGPSHRLVLIALMTVAGGTSYAVYSMVNAHLYDYLEDRLVVAGGARMVLVNGIGAVAGPIVGAAAVGQIGPGALFVVVAAAYATIAVTALVRIVIRPAAPEEDRAEFAPMPVAVGPTTAAMEAELDDVYEPSEGDVRVAGERVHYRDQGDGPPMVLLGRLEAHGPPWRDVLGRRLPGDHRLVVARRREPRRRRRRARAATPPGAARRHLRGDRRRGRGRGRPGRAPRRPGDGDPGAGPAGRPGPDRRARPGPAGAGRGGSPPGRSRGAGRRHRRGRRQPLGRRRRLRPDRTGGATGPGGGGTARPRRRSSRSRAR
ncbi:MAG: MFS transporter, partial [Acidimicrobiales bacterium]|nr:MFS transporter [Acidimicrobiales bacterium]